MSCGNAVYHLRDDNGNPVCGELCGYVFTEDQFKLFIDNGKACKACILTVENKQLKEEIKQLRGVLRGYN